jgi:glycine/serine hydroxymethyltransferase
MIKEMNQYLAERDPVVAAAIDAELTRERDGLELIAS